MGLLRANVFLLKTTLPYTVGFNLTPTFSLGANNRSHNVTLSINIRVKNKYIYIYIFKKTKLLLDAWAGDGGLFGACWLNEGFSV